MNPGAVAPGAPGIPPRWTSSAKSAVGTAADFVSPLWFTLSHGIVNEVYYPRPDSAHVRDIGCLVTDGAAFVSEEKRDCESVVTWLEPGVPAYRVVSTCRAGRYRLHKTVFVDPERPCLVQHLRLEALVGDARDYRLHVLLAPHVGNRGAGNDVWVGAYKGRAMLFASRDGTTIALAARAGWRAASCGYVGASDGWQDLQQHGRLTWAYDEARQGNVAACAELLRDDAGETVVVLGCGSSADDAGVRASTTLLEPWAQVLQRYVDGWRTFHAATAEWPAVAAGRLDYQRISSAMLRVHQAKDVPGGLIASLSIPWGASKGDDDLGGYHLVWPRDQVEAAGAMLAAGHHASARHVLAFLIATQEPDGRWPQCMWLDGRPYWQGVQLDEVAFPILLADALWREGALDGLDAWPMTRRAASFLLREGPATQQDRWEEDAGYSPFTLAVTIAALLAAADAAERAGERVAADGLRATADAWNAQIERWTYVRDTPLAAELGLRGYYVRIGTIDRADAASPRDGFVPIKNRGAGAVDLPMHRIVSPDALALVRVGLRAADDPRIVDTVRAIDATLRTETTRGVVWHRYTFDGYGEHEDGAPFDGTGVGRGWPLLTGERAHYELAAGRVEQAAALCDDMERLASDEGLFPEQTWDAADVPARELYNGRPAGSAMPLVWAHAEYLKLRRSLRDGRVFDEPPQTRARYGGRAPARVVTWRVRQRTSVLPAGFTLRVEALERATVVWTADAWATTREQPLGDLLLGLYAVDLPTADLAPGAAVEFTLRYDDTGRWEGRNFVVAVAGDEP
ncbi:MAG: glucan 1,4-alpha-glucosidase [Vicinamibacterales bacterium]